MRKVTHEVELPDELADLLDELIEEDPKYLSNILLQHLSRKKIYHGIAERKEDGD